MTTERNRIDTDAIKQSIDLVGFARQYTSLKQISTRGEGEFEGPCPCCGGKDQFHVKGQRFYCRKCYPRGGDAGANEQLTLLQKGCSLPKLSSSREPVGQAS